MGIFSKLNAIYNEITNLEKDGTNTFHKYKYTTEASWKRAFQPQFAKQGVVASLDQEEVNTQLMPDGKTFLVTLKGRFKFIDAETEETYSVGAFGAGTDSGDKGLYKAITGAIKYALASTFLVPTGDDPEKDDDSGKEKKTASAKEVKEKGLKELKADVIAALLPGKKEAEAKEYLEFFFKAYFDTDSLPADSSNYSNPYKMLTTYIIASGLKTVDDWKDLGKKIRVLASNDTTDLVNKYAAELKLKPAEVWKHISMQKSDETAAFLAAMVKGEQK